MNPPHAEGADNEATDEIGKNQRLPEKMRGKTKHPREQDAQRYISDEIVHVPKMPNDPVINSPVLYRAATIGLKALFPRLLPAQIR
jgi:hypothetical protein